MTAINDKAESVAEDMGLDVWRNSSGEWVFAKRDNCGACEKTIVATYELVDDSPANLAAALQYILNQAIGG